MTKAGLRAIAPGWLNNLMPVGSIVLQREMMICFMKLKILSRIGLVAAMGLTLGSAHGQSPAAPDSPPAAIHESKLRANVDEVIKLTKAGLGGDVVVAFVKNSRSAFNLKADDILQLKEAGVGSEVVTAMLNHDRTLLDHGQGQPPGPPPSADYNQQWHPPENQPEPGQPPPPQGPVPDPSQPPAQSQPPNGPPPGDMGAPQPPPPQVEVVPVAPGADYYWAPGYWGWNGGWIWVGGGWFPRGYGWGWGYHGGWGYRGGWGGYRGGGGFRGGHR
jgi:hypothetical protein